MPPDVKYQVLFEVQILHDYYRSGKSRDFAFEPTAETMRVLGRRGLLFRPIENGFLVVCGCSGDGTLLRPMENEDRFSFYMLPRAPYLFHYTDLPAGPHAALCYRFHNLNINHGGDELLLTSGVRVSGNDTIPLMPQLFTHRCAVAAGGAVMSICDEYGNEVATKELIPSDGIVQCPADLTLCRPGRYAMRIDGKTELDFYADNDFSRKGAFAVVEIYTDSRVPSSYRPATSGAVAPKTYRIRMGTRETRWRYLVTVRKASERAALISSLQMKWSDAAGSETIAFHTTGSTPLPDSDSRLITFESEKPIALRDEPLAGIKLWAGETVVVENVPNPSVRNIGTGSDSEPVATADLYI